MAYAWNVLLKLLIVSLLRMFWGSRVKGDDRRLICRGLLRS